MNINMLSNILMLAADNEMFEGVRFTTELLPEALRFMVIGMAGIFVALFIIYLACIGLQKLFPEDSEE